MPDQTLCEYLKPIACVRLASVKYMVFIYYKFSMRKSLCGPNTKPQASDQMKLINYFITNDICIMHS